MSTRRQKSESDVNGPPSSRMRATFSMAVSPTLRTAASPKRMAAPSTLKYAELALMSGGRILMPMRRQSSMYVATFGVSMMLVSIAAMNSAG